RIEKRIDNFVLKLRLIADDSNVGIGVQAGGIDLHAHIAGQRTTGRALQLVTCFSGQVVFNERVLVARSRHGENFAAKIFALEIRAAFLGQVFLGGNTTSWRGGHRTTST